MSCCWMNCPAEAVAEAVVAVGQNCSTGCSPNCWNWKTSHRNCSTRRNYWNLTRSRCWMGCSSSARCLINRWRNRCWNWKGRPKMTDQTSFRWTNCRTRNWTKRCWRTIRKTRLMKTNPMSCCWMN